MKPDFAAISHQRKKKRKQLDNPPDKIPGTILQMDEERTQLNGRKDKENDDLHPGDDIDWQLKKGEENLLTSRWRLK